MIQFKLSSGTEWKRKLFISESFTWENDAILMKTQRTYYETVLRLYVLVMQKLGTTVLLCISDQD